MIVDDREDNLLSMETVLEPDGYRIVKATSGRQVLKLLLTDFDFAIILMDVQMPNLNGFETASLIYERERLRHIPIIFITANNYGEENIFKGYRAGAVDYIYKPVNPDLLRAKVAVFVELYRKNQRLIAQEQKLVAINKSLELEIADRIASEEKVTDLNRQLLENIAFSPSWLPMICRPLSGRSGCSATASWPHPTIPSARKDASTCPVSRKYPGGCRT
jgi:CheY-like chemotaxis protein